MASSKASAGVERLSWLLLLLGVLASLGLAARGRYALLARAPRAALDVTTAVPAGPALLITLDVSALSPAATRELVRAGAGSLLGLRELCGFEPVLALGHVAFAVPVESAGHDPDFALIADTTLAPEPVLRCAETMIEKRGGVPVRSRLADFESVRDRARPLGEVAIRKDGLLVLSGGEYFRAVVDAASGANTADEAARLRSALHAGVRRKLGESQLRLSVVGGSLLPLASVQALGVGLTFGRDVELRAALFCPSAAACHEARPLVAQLLAGAASDPRLSVAAKLELVERGAELDVSGRFELEQLGPLLAQLLEP